MAKRWEQPALFSTAAEIKATNVPRDADKKWIRDVGGQYPKHHLETNDELWGRKAREAQESGLTESVKHEGVHTPVVLHEGAVVSGHHRIAAVSAHQFLPVLHGEHGWDDSPDYGGPRLTDTPRPHLPPEMITGSGVDYNRDPDVNY